MICMGKKKDNVVEDTKHVYAKIDGEGHTVRYIDVEVSEVKKEFSLDNMMPYVDRNTVEMLLVPYVTKPEQEYADKSNYKDKCHDHRGDSKGEVYGYYENRGDYIDHANHANYTNHADYTVYSNWGNTSLSQSYNDNLESKFISLSDLIEIREDAEDYGFVYNKATEIVFLANKQAIDVLRSHMYSPLMEFQQEYPQIYSKLLMVKNKL
jgi:hypothetical protein